MKQSSYYSSDSDNEYNENNENNNINKRKKSSYAFDTEGKRKRIRIRRGICKNPHCNHKNFNKKTKKTYVKKFNINENMKIETLDDIIELGKKYHCIENRFFGNINLKILNDLIEPLTELKNMIGMKRVKKNIINQLTYFLKGNKNNKCNNCINCSENLPCLINNDEMLHTVITGPPGVGKTELGKILGKIYRCLGILSKGNFYSATRTDLIAKYQGQTAIKTQEFIDKCEGSVMFIDEAYSLGHSEDKDSYSKEAIDVINKNLTEKRNFLCIIAGYKNSLDKCFFSLNDGLKRRFTFRYDIENYTAEELMEIFLLKLEKNNMSLDKNINKNTLVNIFKTNYNHFKNYGGDIETLLLKSRIENAKRTFLKKENNIINISDIKNAIEELKKSRESKKNDELIPTMYI